MNKLNQNENNNNNNNISNHPKNHRFFSEVNSFIEYDRGYSMDYYGEICRNQIYQLTTDEFSNKENDASQLYDGSKVIRKIKATRDWFGQIQKV